MDISVDLQPLFSYSCVILLIICGCMIVSAAGWVLYLKLKPTGEEYGEKRPVIRMLDMSGNRLKGLKRKYTAALDKISSDLEKGKLDKRAAYQKMRYVVRRFVYRTTGIRTHLYTLAQIRTLENDTLTALMQHCEAPAFAERDDSSFSKEYDEARQLILDWVTPEEKTAGTEGKEE